MFPVRQPTGDMFINNTITGLQEFRFYLNPYLNFEIYLPIDNNISIFLILVNYQILDKILGLLIVVNISLD